MCIVTPIVPLSTGGDREDLHAVSRLDLNAMKTFWRKLDIKEVEEIGKYCRQIGKYCHQG